MGLFGGLRGGRGWWGGRRGSGSGMSGGRHEWSRKERRHEIVEGSKVRGIKASEI